MAILMFDEAQLIRDLTTLRPHSRAVFATACAERLRPAYLAYAALSERGNGAVFEGILDLLWNDLDGNTMSDDMLAAEVEVAMGLIPPDDDEPWFAEMDYADDAAAALVYALGCRRTGDCQEGAWAARRVGDAIDSFIVNKEYSGQNIIDDRKRILSHPLNQMELNRQRRDLEELRAAGTDITAVVGKLRERAKRESASVFNVLS